MYIDVVPNRNSPPAILLRESWREGRRTIKRTIANLSHWPPQKVETLRALLRDEPLVRPDKLVAIYESRPHGHVAAVLGTARRLGMDCLLDPKPSRRRDLVLAMIAERLIYPCSKLATTRLWRESTLADELAVGNAQVEELYDALDWLLERQERIERKLAARHLTEGGLVLYDVSSSYYEGHTCPLAQYGHDRDGKKGLPIIVYGVMTDRRGCPVAVEVYPGNTADPATLGDQVEKLRERFGLEHVVVAGDRGMLTSARIEALRAHPGLGWISALRAQEIQELVVQGELQLSIFDENNLAEIQAPGLFPGERLVACYNPWLAEERSRKREELLQATESAFARIRGETERRTRKILNAKDIAMKVGVAAGRWKMKKHFVLTIEEGRFDWRRDEESIRREKAVDGIYILRTSESKEWLTAEDTVRSYKSLADVERAFRTLKGMDLRIRPIHLRTEDHVRAHILLCLLAYYVEWHMRASLAPLLFEDEELEENRASRDPVAKAEPSAEVRRKKCQRVTPDGGLPIQSFPTLLRNLATVVRHRCRLRNDPQGPSWIQLTDLDPLQARAFELLKLKVRPVKK